MTDETPNYTPDQYVPERPHDSADWMDKRVMRLRGNLTRDEARAMEAERERAEETEGDDA